MKNIGSHRQDGFEQLGIIKNTILFFTTPSALQLFIGQKGLGVQIIALDRTVRHRRVVLSEGHVNRRGADLGGERGAQ